MTETMVKDEYTHEILDMLCDGMVEPRIVIIGCGGAGSNVVSNIHAKLPKATTVIINTDERTMNTANANKKLIVGKTVDFRDDSGGSSNRAERSAKLAKNAISAALQGHDVAFIVAGLGGGSGSGISPVVAEFATEMNIVPFGIAIMPFSSESSSRHEMAQSSLARLRSTTENTIVMQNDSLTRLPSGTLLHDAFAVMDRMALKIVNNVSERMSRSFMSTIVHDIMAVENVATAYETNYATEGSIPSTSHLGETPYVTALPMSGPAQMDGELQTTGGMFMRGQIG